VSDFRGIPAVHRLMDHPSIAPYESLVGRDALRAVIASELDRARGAGGDVPLELLASRIVERMESELSRELLHVVNATGTLLHTNLGRAPLARRAFADAWAVSGGYSNLEYDLLAGERASRYERVTALLRELTGAQEALVVNNCAAAVLLLVDTFAKGAETIVARSELIEIGGGFRLPDVLARSGTTLVEVGATNKTYLADYEKALSPHTALLMRSHRSNFSIEGFTHEVAAEDLVALGRRAGVPVVEDLGSGALVDFSDYGLPHERTVQDAVRDGVGLVAFSGDKLLGGAQAGIIVGSAPMIARLRSNPLLRALRVDKVTLGLLAGTLRLYRSKETREEIPIYRMLATTCDALRERARAYLQTIPSAAAVDSEAFIGGGSLPHVRIPSVAVALQTPYPDQLALRLRRNTVPIVARIESERVLLDLRTIEPEADASVVRALISLLS
jgi:L-seryl-tRNA(Ser) seleniumtransferase